MTDLCVLVGHRSSREEKSRAGCVRVCLSLSVAVVATTAAANSPEAQRRQNRGREMKERHGENGT